MTCCHNVTRYKMYNVGTEEIFKNWFIDII